MFLRACTIITHFGIFFAHFLDIDRVVDYTLRMTGSLALVDTVSSFVELISMHIHGYVTSSPCDLLPALPRLGLKIKIAPLIATKHAMAKHDQARYHSHLVSEVGVLENVLKVEFNPITK